MFKSLVKSLIDQWAWMLDHGGNRSGYIRYYMTFGRTETEALDIYIADLNELNRLDTRVRERLSQ